MSFYGTVINKIDQFWRYIKIGNQTISTNDHEGIEFGAAEDSNIDVYFDEQNDCKIMFKNKKNLKISVEADPANDNNNTLVIEFKEADTQ